MHAYIHTRYMYVLHKDIHIYMICKRTLSIYIHTIYIYIYIYIYMHTGNIYAYTQ